MAALAIGYIPSRLALLFTFMAILACPIKPVYKIVDKVLELYSKRGMAFFVLLIILGFYPLEDFKLLLENISVFLRWTKGLIN